jgi:hypothetical protein
MDELDKGPLHVPLDEPYARMENIKRRKGEIVKKRVVSVHVNEIREMKLIDIEISLKFKKAYVDLITGSLYDPKTGLCYSSSNLKIARKER